MASFIATASSCKEPYKLWNGPTISYDMKIVDGAIYSREYYAPNQPMRVVEKQHRGARGRSETSISTAQTPAPCPPGIC